MVIIKGRSFKSREVLSEADYCFLELLLNEEIRECRVEIKWNLRMKRNDDLIALWTTSIERCEQVLKRLKELT